jgi:hypothetical protein
MADEIQELREHAEEAAHERSLAPVTVTMAILAVLVATITLLGHRAHTEEILLQTKATDQWAYYQAKEIRRHSYELFLDEVSVFSLQPTEKVEQLKQKYIGEVARYDGEQKEIEAEAKKAEDDVKLQERRADRFDLGEVLLESGAGDLLNHATDPKKNLLGIGNDPGAVRAGDRRGCVSPEVTRYFLVTENGTPLVLVAIRNDRRRLFTTTYIGF